MKEHKIYWGDLHTHLEDFKEGDKILKSASENIDFYAVLCYPFIWENKNGLKVESVRQRPEFLKWWKTLQELTRCYYKPGSFVTFLGYEWHGNRTKYGDHNVIYFDENNSLDDTWSLEDLYKKLKGRKVVVIPHHTAYCTGWRGKNWDIYNEDISPVMEIFSQHGSSEGCNTPFPLERSEDMGPGTKEGTFQDALLRGYRIGVIGSNDGPGLPGRWGIGRAAVIADECTRNSIWEAILSRRTYAVTGDRIKLNFKIHDMIMGSVIKTKDDRVDVYVDVEGSNAIDRIELLQNGVVVDTYCHSGKWEHKTKDLDKFKIFVECGWGPSPKKGYKPCSFKWICELVVNKGVLLSTEKCFKDLQQKIILQNEKYCKWELNQFPKMRQGVIFEIKGSPKTQLYLNIERIKINALLADLLNGSRLIPLLNESKILTKKIFGLNEKEINNPDTYFHNARKIKLHKAIPEEGFNVSHIFRNIKLKKRNNYFYVRISQINGQFAWSSPIWVRKE